MFAIVHLFFERIDASAIIFKCRADFLFEVIDDDKVGEEGDEVLDTEKVDAAKEFDRGFDAGGLRDDFLRDGEPEFFAESGRGVGPIGNGGGEFDLVVLECEVHSLHVLLHRAVDVHA